MSVDGAILVAVGLWAGIAALAPSYEMGDVLEGHHEAVENVTRSRKEMPTSAVSGLKYYTHTFSDCRLHSSGAEGSEYRSSSASRWLAFLSRRNVSLLISGKGLPPV